MRKPEALKETMKCPFCGSELKAEEVQCGTCKADVTPGVCLSCWKKNPAGAKACGFCGSPELIVPGKSIPAPTSAPVFFSASPFKVTVMCLATLGFYQIYWFYKNWKLIKEREKTEIMPFWRAVFSVFYCASCFNRIGAMGGSLGLGSSINAGILSAVWILLTIAQRLPDPYWLVSFLSFLCLLPVQSLANSINSSVSPDFRPNERFTGWDIPIVIFGGLLFILLLGATFFPSK